ncbi:glutamate-1-semialdehyde 2,1-aminomutase 2 [Alicyclobacillus sacchari]|nr:glutamate-1-semialdehyde 2,1-aminomutase 2 [Alicyclobacillus sacchari]
MVLDRTQSKLWFERAQAVILGGVNSPSRSYKSVGGGTPTVMVRGQGSRMYDVDGNEYIDYLAAYGPSILGHAHPAITEAIAQAAADGVLYGTPTPSEVLFAEKLRQAIPDLERIRFVNSGTEAVMTTIRVARAYTGRRKVLKFAGCYHGHSDAMLVAAGSGPSSIGVPDSAGVTPNIASEVITVPFNDPDILAQALDVHGADVAAVLVEPIVGNFGIVPPRDDRYLEQVIDLAHRMAHSLSSTRSSRRFVFITAAPHRCTTCIRICTRSGRSLAAAYPLAHTAGERTSWSRWRRWGLPTKLGPWLAIPCRCALSMACLDVLREPGIYENMARRAQVLTEAAHEAAKRHGVPITINRMGGAYTIYFGHHPVHNYDDANATDSKQFAQFFHLLADRKILIAPSKYEAWFVSAVHTDDDIERTVAVYDEVFRDLGRAVR